MNLKKLCNSITIIPDNDVAGKTACDKSAQMILPEGMNCNVIQLPDSEEKLDADSFFTDARHFQKYANDCVQDYIITKAKRWSKLPSAPENTRRAIEEITDLIFKMDPGSHDLYMDQVSRLIKPKKAWQDKIKELFVQGTHEVDREDKKDRIPDEHG